MRQLQRIVHDLKSVVVRHKPGDDLQPPSSLSSLIINGRRVSYIAAGLEADHGETPPVVLLHGFGGFFMDWPRVMAPLARHTRVYAIDLPGWGFSEPNPLARSLEEEVHFVHQFLVRLELNNAILCGISYGAGVAWACAAMHVPRIHRAILLNPMPTHPLRYLRSPIYRGIFALNSLGPVGLVGHRFLTKSQYKIICRENLLNDRLLDSFYLDLAYLVIKQPKMPLILGAHARGARSVDWAMWEHRLATIRMPVSILQGKQDKIFSMESATHLHRLIPTSELIEVNDCGHAMVFDQHRKAADFILRQVHRLRETHESIQKDLRQKY